MSKDENALYFNLENNRGLQVLINAPGIDNYAVIHQFAQEFRALMSMYGVTDLKVIPKSSMQEMVNGWYPDIIIEDGVMRHLNGEAFSDE